LRVAGIMSGTSLDGIDVAIVDVGKVDKAGRKIRPVAFHSTPYPEAVRKAILGVSNTTVTTVEIARLHVRLGQLYARAVEQTCRRRRVPLRSIKLVGCHGQTIYHQGEARPFLGQPVAATLQIGEAGVIAEALGVPVVSDFRMRDMAAGGKGAPLVPYVDYLLFRHAKRGRVALNIGGIANITAIPPDAAPGDLMAFDTGPGNMVIDALVSELTSGRERFDRGGQIAAQGSVNRALLDAVLTDPYYRERPPKTAGREQYGAEFIARLKQTGLPLIDLIATATALTPAAIAAGIERFVRPRMRVDEIIAAGGGVHNRTLMAYLQAFLPNVQIRRTDEFGISADAKEAIAFAVLAHETYRGRASNLPSATGAKHAVILGKVTY
jgi:anhydro-N-acetylmuramic acid kinase